MRRLLDGAWDRVAEGVVRWPARVLLLSIVAAAACVPGLTRLRIKTGQDQFVPTSSAVYRDNQAYQATFGGDAMVVMLSGPMAELTNPHNLSTLAALQDELAKRGDLLLSVTSPISLVRFAIKQLPIQQEAAMKEIGQLQAQAAAKARADALAVGKSPAEVKAAEDAASQAALTQYLAQHQAEIDALASAGTPSIDNPAFVRFVLLGSNGKPRPEVAGIVPDSEHFLLVVTLRGNLPLEAQSSAAKLVYDAAHAAHFTGLGVVASGSPLLVRSLETGMRHSIAVMAVVTVLVMVLVLAFLFPARWRLLAIIEVLLTTTASFGLIGYLAIPLTLATISGLPILLGLGVDFAIQVHNRYEEETARSDSRAEAMAKALRGIGPPLVVAVIAGLVGFLALLWSAVPLIHLFAAMLAVGAVVLFIYAIAVIGGALSLRDREARFPAGEVHHNRWFDLERILPGLIRTTVSRPFLIVFIGLVAAILGVMGDRRLVVKSQPEQFLPSNNAAVRDLRQIEAVAGSNGSLDLYVWGGDMLRPDVLQWMLSVEQKELSRHPDTLLSASSVASLLKGSTPSGQLPDQQQAKQILTATPPDLSSQVIAPDYTQAAIVFVMKNLPLTQQKQLTDEIMSELPPPPAGVHIAPAGLSVIGAEAASRLAANRDVMALIALGFVFVALTVVYRDPLKSFILVFPVALMVGWTGGMMWLLHASLNPLTSVAGPLIVAMGIEFHLLLTSRYTEERAAGVEPRAAMLTAARHTGRAITVSGLTMVAGFAALMAADFPLVQDFGKVTTIAFLLSLISALVVLPPALVWADEHLRAAGEPAEAPHPSA